MVDTLTLKQRQSLPLDVKITLSKKRIREWYESFNGEVYVSFSGGKDSTVLLHLVRSLFPEVEAVFVDTGLEYPEIRKFVRTFDNVKIVIPKMPFFKVIEKFGYPLISKSVSSAISRYKNTKSEVQRKLRLYGGINPTSGKKQVMGVIPKKYHYLLKENINISEKCCDIMKKQPFKRYEKETKKKPIIGTMASESNLRKIHYLKYGCNAFDKKSPMSSPLSFWTEQDILKYIKKFNLKYSEIYGEIKKENGKYLTTGEKRTGCMFCMYGVHKEESPNRFERMKITHPKIYDYCINGTLNLKKPLKLLGVKY